MPPHPKERADARGGGGVQVVCQHIPNHEGFLRSRVGASASCTPAPRLGTQTREDLSPLLQHPSSPSLASFDACPHPTTGRGARRPLSTRQQEENRAPAPPQRLFHALVHSSGGCTTPCTTRGSRAAARSQPRAPWVLLCLRRCQPHPSEVKSLLQTGLSEGVPPHASAHAASLARHQPPLEQGTGAPASRCSAPWDRVLPPAPGGNTNRRGIFFPQLSPGSCLWSCPFPRHIHPRTQVLGQGFTVPAPLPSPACCCQQSRSPPVPRLGYAKQGGTEQSPSIRSSAP